MKGIKFGYVSWEKAATRAVTVISVWTLPGVGTCVAPVEGGAA